MDDLVKNENVNQENEEIAAQAQTETEDVAETEENVDNSDNAEVPEDVQPEETTIEVSAVTAEEQPTLKKKSKAKVIIPVLILVVALIAGAVCFFFFGNPIAKVNDSEELNLFEENLVSVCKDGKWGYMNKSGEIVIDYQFEDVGIFKEDGLAYVVTDGKYGFIDKTGAYIINPQYDDAGPYCDGLAYVKHGEEYGYVNTLGEVAIKYQYDNAYSFRNGYAVVVVGENWGIIDETGKYVINPQYSTGYYGLEVYYVTSALSVDNIEDILIPAMKDEKYGYIDVNGNIVIDFQFDDAFVFSDEGYAVVCVGEKYGLIDRTGKYVINTKYDELLSCGENLYSFAVDNKYGLVSVDGTEVAAAQFDDISSIGDGYFIVEIGEKVGMIDATGTYIINPTNQYLGGYRNNLMIVKNNDKCGYINLAGEIIVNYQFDDATEFMNSGLAKVCLNGKYGYINTKGEYVINATYHQASMMYDDGFAWVIGDDKKMSIIDKEGNVIVSGLDGVDGTKKEICSETGCYEIAEDDGTLCEKHSFNFYKVLEELNYSSSSYVDVEDDGMSLTVTAYWYSYLEEFDDGATVALKVADYFGCNNLEDTIEGDIINVTYGNYNIKIECDWYYSSNYYYFTFEATQTQSV